MSNETANTLSEDNLAELDDFLLSEQCDADTLSVDEAHGYLTALIVGPEEPEQAHWMKAIWGEPQFTDDAQREAMQGLLLGMHDEIADTLAKRLPFEPLAVEEEEEGEGEVFVIYEGWCYGFMLGVNEAEEEWASIPEDEQGLLAPMAQLALLNDEEEADMDEAEYESWVELLPGAVVGLYGYWRGQAD